MEKKTKNLKFKITQMGKNGRIHLIITIVGSFLYVCVKSI